jgi:RHS repeat-associated protein
MIKRYQFITEHISSCISGGKHDAMMLDVFTGYHLSEHYHYKWIATDLLKILNLKITCYEMNPSKASFEHTLQFLEKSIHQSEPNRYIYHSDHLGSSSFLTDASGDPTQHLQYMPFGETFVEQRSTTAYYTPYTFSAKERDPETGYSYFGARYYSSDISVWLSVDPMAHKYPSMSAYMYVGGHVINIIDPDGRDWIRDENGNYVYDKNVTKNTKLRDGQIYLGVTGVINVVNSEGASLYKYQLNADGSFTDSRGLNHQSGSGTFNPNFKSGHKIMSPTITERTAKVFSDFSVGYLADNKSTAQLTPIIAGEKSANDYLAAALIGYLGMKEPVVSIFTIGITTIAGLQIEMSKSNSEAYAKQGKGKGMYVSNITGPGVPIPRAAMFSAHDGSFIGWHTTIIKGAPEMTFNDYQKLLAQTKNLR